MPKNPPAPCPHRQKLGKNVAALRKAKNLTQEKLAEGAGLSARYVQSIEAGEYFPSLAVLVRLKRKLGCSWDELLRGG